MPNQTDEQSKWFYKDIFKQAKAMLILGKRESGYIPDRFFYY